MPTHRFSSLPALRTPRAGPCAGPLGGLGPPKTLGPGDELSQPGHGEVRVVSGDFQPLPLPQDFPGSQTAHHSPLAMAPWPAHSLCLTHISEHPSSPTNWTTVRHSRPRSHYLVGTAWSARGHLQGRTLSLELSQPAFLPTKHRPPVVFPGGDGS